MELPESRNLAAQINAALKSRKISEVVANKSPHKFAWFSGDPAGYKELLTEKRISFAASYGGMVEIQTEDIRLIFSDGTNIRFLAPEEKIPDKHQLCLKFDDGSSLVMSVQMYGSLWALKDGETEKYNEIARSKPDPLTSMFDRSYFQTLLGESEAKLSAKAFLATNQRIPGLGNGVLQDILFNAGIHPKRKMSTLSVAEFDDLYNSLKDTLKVMTSLGGRDTEKDIFGVYGGYETLLSAKTYGRPCPKCQVL